MTTLLEEIENVLKDNFIDGEVKLDQLVDYCDLYYITSDSIIKNVNKIKQGYQNDYIVGICFVRNNIIYCFCILKNCQKQGYAKKLLRYVLSHHSRVELHVRCSNVNAIDLYSKCGFNIINVIPDFYQYTSNNEHAFKMEYRKP